MFKRLLFLLFLLSGLAQAAGDARLAQNITALEAYDRLMSGAGSVYLLDVRSPEEYQLVGHPPMAYNIPFVFLRGGPHRNSHFVEDVAARFKKTDTLLVICRSGGRSAPAADALVRAGFKHVYNVRDGFEGAAFTGRTPKEKTLLRKYSPFYGRRGRVEGWQYDGLPYTYELKDELLYRPYDAAKHR
ncbi:hypothetical protein MIN45_P1216 [Methylomarinovum tepidoasis]|uniref:Rhodanese domain-containing protein n=1 Tax=Methylomarinovum tepidoasis TaxID=2840183 RepID=A0AAU9CDG5_9GAMM|nr:rhodanese-like domain-containing protein [Methylomarinovum sp. IN45]BCX88846.1 hypothetical protein MIN45_P1216 [Methylomarinovum sp. IN45]